MRRAYSWPWLRIGCAALAGAVAGLPTGLVTLGAGSRLAMRLTALMAGPAAQGRETDAGAVVGQITGGGTGFLIGAGGAIGLLLGIVYMGVRGWLPRPRGIWFAAGLTAVLGSFLVEHDNRDFADFGNPVVNVAMFLALPMLFGLALPALADRLHRRLPAPPVSVGWAALYTLVMIPLVLLPVNMGIADLGPLVVIPIALLIVATVIVVRGRPPTSEGADTQRVRVGRLLLVGVALAGLGRTVWSVVGALS